MQKSLITDELPQVIAIRNAARRSGEYAKFVAFSQIVDELNQFLEDGFTHVYVDAEAGKMMAA